MKNIISIIISILIVITFNFKSSAKNFDNNEIIQKIEQKIEYNTISFNNQNSRKEFNFLWISNILIAGLSQILMGDINRGLKFLYIEATLIGLDILIILGLQPLLSLFLAPSESMKALAIQVLLVWFVIILIIGNKIWSIIDSISMINDTNSNTFFRIETDKMYLSIIKF